MNSHSHQTLQRHMNCSCAAMKQPWLLVLACMMVGIPLQAQFKDSLTHWVNFNSTGVINRTNDGSSYVLNNNLRFGISKKTMALNVSNSWVYGNEQDGLTNNDFNSSVDFNLYTKKRKWYYWGLANYTTSFSLKITDQFQGGVGVGYNIMEQKVSTIVISEGILYEANDLIRDDTLRDIYQTFRNSARLKFRFEIAGRITLDGTYYWQPSLVTAKDYIIKSSTTCGVKLYKWLSLTAAFTNNKFNRTQRENLLFTYGLSFERYF